MSPIQLSLPVKYFLYCILYVMLVCSADVVCAQVTVYDNEQEYLTALSNLGYVQRQESFENNDYWGLLETDIAPDVTHEGVTWGALGSGIDLRNSVRQTGQWGLNPSPAATPINGFIGSNTGTQTMFGVGGWVRSGNQSDVFLNINGDATPVDENGVDSNHEFFGVIDTGGITSFTFTTEAVEGGDAAKQIYLDNFTYGFDVAPSLRELGTAWNSAAGGNYDSAGNWSGGSVPGPATNAIFNLGNGSAYTVDFSQNETATQAVVASGSLVFDLGGNQVDLTESNITRESLIVGEIGGDTANLAIRNGTVNTGNTVVAHSSGTSGSLTIESSGTLASSGALRVGSGGTGVLNIDGGSASSSTGTLGQLNGNGTANLTNGGSWTVGALNVGIGGTGTLNVSSGSTLTASTLTAGNKAGNGLANEPLGSGAASFSGAGTQVNATTVVIGQTGISSLSLSDGVQVNSRIGSISMGADSSATVSGPTTNWTLTGARFNQAQLTVGAGDQVGTFFSHGAVYKTGSLTIENKATVATEDLFIGRTRTGLGTITVTGTGSLLQTTRDSYVGYEGDGVLNITNGAALNSGRVFVGRLGIRNLLQGELNVDGPASTWDANGVAYIGYNNNSLTQPYNAGSLFFSEGTVNITGGATASATALEIGRQRLSKGNLNIEGAGSSMSVDSVQIGRLETFTGGIIGRSREGTGHLTLSDGGHLDVVGDVRMDAGSLVLANGSISASTILIRGKIFDIDTPPILSGIGLITADVINSGGFVSPGQSAGILNIDGDFTQLVDGTMQFEIGGLMQGTEYDFLEISGGAILDGLVDVELLNGFVPAAGNEFTLLMATTLEGQFDNGVDSLPALQSELQWDIEYSSNSVVLRVLDASVPGDFDSDGDVDVDDINFYVGNIGSAATGAIAQLDLTSDGQITSADLQTHIETDVQTSNGETGTFLGDLNLNGTVNVLGDAFALVGNLGNSATSYAQGDINLDGTVNVLGDAFVLVGNLNKTNASSTASTSAVPEPGSLSLLAITTVGLVSRRKRS